MKNFNYLIAAIISLGIITGYASFKYLETNNFINSSSYTSALDTRKLAHLQCPSSSNGAELCPHTHTPPTPPPTPATDPTPNPETTTEDSITRTISTEENTEENTENNQETITRDQPETEETEIETEEEEEELPIPKNTEEQNLIEQAGGNPHNQINLTNKNIQLNDEDAIKNEITKQIDQKLGDILIDKLFVTITEPDGNQINLTESPEIIIASNIEEYKENLYFKKESTTPTIEDSENTNMNTGALIDFTSDEFAVFEESTDQIIIGPFNDSDLDGLSDFSEIILYNTNPFTADSDNDGTLDQDEIDKGFDPLKSRDADYKKEGITNLINNDVNQNFLIKGFSYNENVIIEAQKINITDEEEVVNFQVCETNTDKNGKFTCEINGELQDGSYYLYQKDVEYENNRIARVNVKSDSNENFTAELAEEYDLITTTKENYSKEFFQKFLGETIYNKYFKEIIESKSRYNKDRITILKGQAEVGSIIIVTWRSLILSSTVIADASQGEYQVYIPKELERGEHNILVYAYNPQTEFISNFIKLVFSN